MITILMATYNGEKYLPGQIDSILSQTVTSWQLIIQDDCSTDGTLTIAQQYSRKYPGKIRVLKRDTPSGAAKNNFISMLSLVDTRYCMTCDQDDIWLPDKIHITLNKMLQLEKEHGKNTPLLVHTDLQVVDEHNNLISKSFFAYQKFDCRRDKLNHLLVQNIVTGCTIMVNRPLLDQAGQIPQNAIMHDWWLALVASVFGAIGFVPAATILYRQHGNNAIGAKKANSSSYIIERLAKIAETSKAIRDTYKQAEDLLAYYNKDLSDSKKEICSIYISIKSHKKPVKLMLIHKHDFWRSGLVRKLGQILLM